MSKAQINNEIILLRQSVEQARVQTVAKLSRAAFKLRTKKGTEEQKVKNLRKADRIAAEILAVKKVKKDEITKYALANELNLNQILRNESEPLPRIMARIANHKKFSEKIAEFKNKYPNYAEFLGPGRKKKAIQEWKEKKKLKKVENQKNDESSTNTAVDKENEASYSENSESNDENSDDESEVNDDANENEDMSSEISEQEEDGKGLDKSETTIVKSTKTKKNKKVQSKVVKKEVEEKVANKENVKSTKIINKKKNKKLEAKNSNKQDKKTEELNEKDSKCTKNIKSELVETESNKKVIKSTKNKKSEPVEIDTAKTEKSKKILGKRKKKQTEKDEGEHVDEDIKPDVKKKKSDTSKVISKQAIVKKFTDILKEEEVKSEKKSEANGDSDKSNLKIEKEVDSFFFSGDGSENYLSVALPKNQSNEEEEDYGNDRFNKKKFSRQQNDNFFSKVNKFKNNSDSRYEGQRHNEGRNGRDNPGFNKFNGNRNDRFNDRPNNRFNGKPNDRFNDRPNNKFNGKPNNKFNDRPNNKFNDRPNNKFNDKPNSKFGNDRKDKSFKTQGRDKFESKSNEVLHPSWEAKKKQQDILKKGFQGKKIVFGDD